MRNIDKFKADLLALITQGHDLENSLHRACFKDDFDSRVKKLVGKEKAAEVIKALPDFKTSYEAWYSEALAVIRQVLPDRLADFVSLYERAKGRKILTNENYVIRDYLHGLTLNRNGEVVVPLSAAIPQMRQQVAILKAAERRFESSLFDMAQLVQADLFDSELESARELLRHKFLRAAGAVAGVVLEKHLRSVIDARQLPCVKKNPNLSDLSEILKSNGVVDIPEWRKLSHLADVRNLCDHNKAREPTADEVTDLIDGTARAVKNIS